MRGCPLKPLADRVVVLAEESPDKSPGGIVLPDNAKERPTRGEVLAVGPGKLLESGERAAMEVEIGDTVVYGIYSGDKVKEGDEEYTVLREDQIIAVL